MIGKMDTVAGLLARAFRLRPEERRLALEALAAHAWATGGGLPVTGGERRRAFTPITRFAP